jgi:Tol biopolymer transport system component
MAIVTQSQSRSRTNVIVITCFGFLTASFAYANSDNLKHPDWHPDGRYLVSEGSCTGNTDLYLIDTQSGSVTPLYSSEYMDGYPRWFADGKRIAFHQIDLRRNSRIHVATASLDSTVSNVRPVTDGPFDIEPAPSPDGMQLIFSGKDNDRSNISLQQLENGRTKVWETTYVENFPSWHPDGNSLIFHAKKSDGTQIYQRSLVTYKITAITETGSPNIVGHISLDGQRMTFSSERDGDREIYIRDLKSGSEERLTNRPGRDGYPKFSPSGKRIAYHSELDDKSTVVRIKNIASGDRTEYSCSDVSQKPSS